MGQAKRMLGDDGHLYEIDSAGEVHRVSVGPWTNASVRSEFSQVTARLDAGASAHIVVAGDPDLNGASAAIVVAGDPDLDGASAAIVVAGDESGLGS